MRIPPLYTLFDDGSPIPEKKDRNVYLLGIQAYAKELDEGSDYEFASEFICGELGQMIGLPVSRGVFVERKRKKCYASFNSCLAGRVPPMKEPRAIEFVHQMPFDACGVCIFDIFINNKDRNATNLGWDRAGQTVHIFDHGNALILTLDPVEFWRANWETVDLSRHCLSPYITGPAMMNRGEWEDRIRQIPNDFIRRIIRDSQDLNPGLSPQEGDIGIEYLINRKDKITEIVDKAQQFFPRASIAFQTGKETA